MSDEKKMTTDQSPGPWVARVEHEEPCYDGSSRMEAVAAALDAFCGDVDAGWNDVGDYTVHVWSDCTFRVGNPDCQVPGGVDERHEWMVDGSTVAPSALASVYESTDGEVVWRLADGNRGRWPGGALSTPEATRANVAGDTT